MSNVESAKLFFGIVLDKLQMSFTAAVHLTPQDVWPEFEKLANDQSLVIKDGKRSFREIQIKEASESTQIKTHYFRLMLGWMAKEGYVHSDPTSNFHSDYVLSSKALAILNLSLVDEKTTLGTALSRATGRFGDAVQGEVVSRLIGRAFEAAQGISA
jgi:hypothetical protein